jgi:hypothetical protein
MIRVKRAPGCIEISHRPFGLLSFVALAFAVLWDMIALNLIPDSGSLIQAGASPLPLMFVAIGVGITIYAVYSLVSSTHITLRSGQITAVRHPLPFFTRIELKLSTLRLLSVLRYQPNRSIGGGPASYNVFAVTHDRRSIKIARGLSSEEGTQIKSEIESYLASNT